MDVETAAKFSSYPSDIMVLKVYGEAETPYALYTPTSSSFVVVCQPLRAWYTRVQLAVSWGPDDKFDAKFVKQMLKDYDLELDGFTAGDLLRGWRKY